jgi:hypothetical protein
MRHLTASAMLLLLLASGPALAQVDTALARRVYAEVNGALARLDKVSVVARRPDDARRSEIAAWADASGIRKLQVTHRANDGDVVTEYYYARGALVFAYRAVKGYNAAGWPVTRDEERQYFRDGAMIRWLSGMDRIPNNPRSEAFARQARARLAASAFYVRSAERAFDRRTSRR